MTSTSYPSEGNGGLTAARWPQMTPSDGIIKDFSPSGTSMKLLTNSDDTVLISPGLVRVAGYVFNLSVGENLSTPPVSTTTQYLIAVMYDPSLNTPDGSGNAPAAGPCRLIVATNSLDLSGGKQYVLLHVVTRTAGVALGSSTIADFRRWTGDLVSDANQASQYGNFFPRGSVTIDASGNAFVRRPNTAGDDLVWQPVGVNTPVTTGIATASTGWSVTSQWARKASGTTHVRLIYTYNSGGADITGAAAGATNPGDLSPDVTIGNVVGGWGPALSSAVVFCGGTVFGSGVIMVSTGAVTIQTLYPSGKIRAGDSVTISTSYPSA